MTTETQQYIELSRKVVAAAQGDTLQPHTAVQFCLHVLPRLLVELEIAQRVDARLAERFSARPPEPEAVRPESRLIPSPPPKAKKKKPTTRKKRKAKNDTAS